jgi:flap endonuclease-1
MKQDAIRLLQLMGFPVIEAKAEAEAQCVQLVKEKKARAVASDDMDCLTFGAETLVRGIKTKKEPVTEICLADVLKELGLTMDQFIDFCILCGCDYCDAIENVGPVKAFNFIKEHKTIETVLEHIQRENKEKEEAGKQQFVLPSPENFNYQMARDLFRHPDVHIGLEDVG